MPDLDTRIAEIEARVNAATPGPWSYSWTQVPPQVRDDEPVMHCVTADIPERAETLMGMIVHAHEDRGNSWDAQNAAFIANAREDIPFLLAALQQAREALREIADGSGGSYQHVDTLREIARAALAPEQTKGAG